MMKLDYMEIAAEPTVDPITGAFTKSLLPIAALELERDRALSHKQTANLHITTIHDQWNFGL